MVSKKILFSIALLGTIGSFGLGSRVFGAAASAPVSGAAAAADNYPMGPAVIGADLMGPTGPAQAAGTVPTMGMGMGMGGPGWGRGPGGRWMRGPGGPGMGGPGMRGPRHAFMIGGDMDRKALHFAAMINRFGNDLEVYNAVIGRYIALSLPERQALNDALAKVFSGNRDDMIAALKLLRDQIFLPLVKK